tara:strand:+ start:23 stop:742 length:720 start_codon:yes stop_codon:yes gene_type:complete
MKEQSYVINGINVVLKKNSKAKNISISIQPFKGVRVTVPRYATFKQALSFVNHKMKWIESKYTKIKLTEAKYSEFKIDTVFSTRNHQLIIQQKNIEKINSKIKDGKIIVNLPFLERIEKIEIQKFIRSKIEEAWRLEAKEILPVRIEKLAKENKLNYNKLTIKNTRSRWGSCSYNNNINLSLHLMRLPDHLIDYVLLHELAHTKIKNHSKEFWNFLDEISNYKGRILDKELKEHSLRIY